MVVEITNYLKQKKLDSVRFFHKNKIAENHALRIQKKKKKTFWICFPDSRYLYSDTSYGIFYSPGKIVLF